MHEQKHLEDIFANTGGIIATHAEDEIRLRSRIAEFSHESDIAAHAECRDVECALLATKRASALAKDYDHRLHIVHLTSGSEADWLAKQERFDYQSLCSAPLLLIKMMSRKRVRLLMNPQFVILKIKINYGSV